MTEDQICAAIREYVTSSGMSQSLDDLEKELGKHHGAEMDNGQYGFGTR
jgi:hypothetical protein